MNKLKPFFMVEHEHVPKFKACVICHIHMCDWCGFHLFCSDPSCKRKPGERVLMKSQSCPMCVGGKEIKLCTKCGSRFMQTFPKCPYCFFKEMKEFWKDNFLPAYERPCRCNRCGG